MHDIPHEIGAYPVAHLPNVKAYADKLDRVLVALGNTLNECDAAMVRKREEAGCFLLLTQALGDRTPAAGYPALAPGAGHRHHGPVTLARSGHSAVLPPNVCCPQNGLDEGVHLKQSPPQVLSGLVPCLSHGSSPSPSYFSFIEESEPQIKTLAYVGISACIGFILAPHTTFLYNASSLRRRWKRASGCRTEGGFWAKNPP
jgi:hypothetical protein